MVSWWVLLPIKKYDSTRKGLGRESHLVIVFGGLLLLSLELICGKRFANKKGLLSGTHLLAGKGLEKEWYCILMQSISPSHKNNLERA